MRHTRLTFLIFFAFVVLTGLPRALASDEDAAYEKEVFYPTFCKASLPSTPIYAGSSVDSVIACINMQDETEPKEAFLLIGYLQPLHSYDRILQNFSVVRHGKVLEKGEAVTFQYTFVPSSYLEANEYNLVLGLFARSPSAGQSEFLVAYNATISIHPSNMDPQLIMTYLILVAVLCGIIYGIASKLGLLQPRKQKHSPKSSPESSQLGSSCDMSYVSKEHQRYCEELLSQSTSRHTSPKRKK